MILLSLAAQICQVFSSAGEPGLRTVQKVKDDLARDVVTSLDERLHDTAADFVAKRMPKCRLLSEESDAPLANVSALRAGEWLVVDPLDGSNNFALSLPGFGFMAAHVREGAVTGSVIVLPEHDLYIVLEGDELLISQPFAPVQAAASGSVYYAYPPKLSSQALASRVGLMDLVDQRSSGLYRYGSACIGLYNLLRGKHAAFIGHSIRIWDALAYLPLLHRFGISAKYCVDGAGRLTLLAAFDAGFVADASSIVAGNERIELVDLTRDAKLVGLG